MKFLVTDDYESMRIMIGDHLRQLGVENITFASSGNEAFTILQSKVGKPDEITFILTDLIMENGTGIELAKKVRAEAALKHVPILMITSKAEISYILEAAKAGVNSYIVKPWKLEDLAKKIVENSKPK
jgi:two-component system chemotaxis response regulator CheY